MLCFRTRLPMPAPCIETLKVFCDLVDTGSFRSPLPRTSSRSRPSASRSGRWRRATDGSWSARQAPCPPTPAGEIFYEISKDIVSKYQDLEGRLRAFSNIVAGTVRVATVHSVGLYEFSDELKRYVKAYPNVNVRLEYEVEPDLRGRAQRHARRGRDRVPDPSSADRLIPSARTVSSSSAARAPVREAEGVSIKARRAELRRLRRRTSRRTRRSSALQKHAIRVQYVAEVDNIEWVIKKIVEVGTGISIAPEPAVRPEVRNKSLIAIDHRRDLHPPLGIIIHKEGRHFSPAAEKFIETLIPAEHAPTGDGGAASRSSNHSSTSA